MTPSQRHPLPVTAIGAALLCVLSLVARDARAESGLQIAPDHKRTLVSKDVGGQRWSMVYNEDDGTAIGNVYDANGGEPSFVWCRTVATASDTITFECSGADRCAAFMRLARAAISAFIAMADWAISALVRRRSSGVIPV